LERKIRVGAVSYLNTKPLLFGIENSPIIHKISLITEYPSRIADMLLRDEIDIGLVPVSIIPQLKEYHINTQYAIGCDGPVASVCLFSQCPMDEIDTVLLDYQSRTSVALVRLLFKKHWRKDPKFQSADPDFLQSIQGRTAAIVIGDRALEQRKKSAYTYDLGEAWKELTGLPFVFAAWISNKVLDPEWVEQFNQANSFGIQNISRVIQQIPETNFDLNEYYTRFLSYDLDGEKKKGLDLFLQWLTDK
jgi:chorismate dehydratase